MYSITTEKGVMVWLENVYSPEAVAGVSVLVVASSLSLIAVVGMLTAILISSFKTGHAFIRSHLGAYFVSLILAELIQAIGSLLSIRWLYLQKVRLGYFCATQAALKNAGNVSTALWSMIIAFHTFTLTFLNMRVPPWAFYSTLALTWTFVGTIVIIGPAIIENKADGPFWGVSGYWCWITEGYSLERFTMEYLFMFVTAGVTIVLYFLIFLRMRGNIEGTGFRITFCRTSSPWQRNSSLSEPQIERVGKRMLLYPMAYVVLVLPVAACRWSETFGSKVPFAVFIFADTVFVLSGFVNAILYSTTRRVAPIATIIPTYKSRQTSGENLESGDSKGMESFVSGGMGEISEHAPLSSTPQLRPPHTAEEFSDVPHLSAISQRAPSPWPAPSVVSSHVEDRYPGPTVNHSSGPTTNLITLDSQGHPRHSAASSTDAWI